jgi:hypothetical protein
VLLEFFGFGHSKTLGAIFNTTALWLALVVFTLMIMFAFMSIFVLSFPSDVQGALRVQ